MAEYETGPEAKQRLVLDCAIKGELGLSRGRAAAARLAHNQEVGGSNPSPATIPPLDKYPFVVLS